MARKNQSRRFCIGIITTFLLFILPGCASDSVEEISLNKLAKLPAQHPIVVVNFWATWCPPCLMEVPHLNRLHTERPDVHIYGISIDDAALAREVYKFVERYKMRYPVYMRERMNRDESKQEWYLNVDAIPMTYIFKNGTLHNTIFGAIEKRNELMAAIDGPSEEELYAQEETGDDEDIEAYSDEEEE